MWYPTKLGRITYIYLEDGKLPAHSLDGHTDPARERECKGVGGIVDTAYGNEFSDSVCVTLKNVFGGTYRITS
jgi:hypothetical protein